MVCLGATSFGADRGKQPRFAPYPPPIPAPSQVGDADDDSDDGDHGGDAGGNGGWGKTSTICALQFLQSQANVALALTRTDTSTDSSNSHLIVSSPLFIPTNPFQQAAPQIDNAIHYCLILKSEQVFTFSRRLPPAPSAPLTQSPHFR